MKQLQQQIRTWLISFLPADIPVSADDVHFSIPTDRKFGDLSTTLPFLAAKKTGEKPYLIAKKIVESAPSLPEMVEKFELAGGGFLNFHLRRDPALSFFLQEKDTAATEASQRVVVEHTSINPNKAAHIGHLRNSCLGDVLANGYRFLGYEVEVQNYIDDTGIQMADVVWGLLYHEKKSLEEIRAISDLAEYLWRLYPEVNQVFESDEEKSLQRREVHKRIEDEVNPEHEVCRYIARQVLLDHIRVMSRIGIRYDLLVHESDIIAMGLFEETASLLKQKQIMYPSADSSREGCFVIFYEKEKLEKIIVRSNDTITYVGKDIANTLWKFGLLQKDFYYDEFFRYPDSRPIWSTVHEPRPPSPHRFAHADRAINVIDVRQSYLQSLINQVLFSLGHESAGRGFQHYAYEMVALTPACVRELGLEIDEDEEKKNYVEVSGRKGRAVRAGELIDKLVEKSMQEVRGRNPEMTDSKVKEIAGKIAIAALRYFMIKFHLNTVIAFDFKEALSFEGDTGPYLLYTLVRLRSILQKLRENQASSQSGISLSVLDEKERDMYWEIMLHLSMLELQVAYALDHMDISSLASFAYQLCQKVNHYYHQYPVLSETLPERKWMRVLLVRTFVIRMEQLLNIMGISIPEKM